jgi:hypothetical protein
MDAVAIGIESEMSGQVRDVLGPVGMWMGDQRDPEDRENQAPEGALGGDPGQQAVVVRAVDDLRYSISIARIVCSSGSLLRIRLRISRSAA